MRVLLTGLVVAVVAFGSAACDGGDSDVASPGCREQPKPGSRTVTVRYDGLDRRYDLVVPDATAGTPLPVVLGYHGLGEGIEPFVRYTQLARHAEAEEFIAVFPEGDDLEGTAPRYHNIETVDDPSLADDVGFASAILDDLEATLCVDRSRIFGMGFSNGGAFVSTLACELGDRIAAVAPVGGVHRPPDCDSRRVPMIVTHGTTDPVVPFEDGDASVALDVVEDFGGSAAQRRMLAELVGTSVTSWVASWAEGHGCTVDDPAVETSGALVTITTFEGCDAGADVVFQAITGGGHEWPAGSDLDATARALEFFWNHPLPDT